MVCRHKDILYSKRLAHWLEELSSELLSVIRYDALWGSIRKDPVLNEGYGNVISGDLTQRYDARKFRESVCDLGRNTYPRFDFVSRANISIHKDASGFVPGNV